MSNKSRIIGLVCLLIYLFTEHDVCEQGRTNPNNPTHRNVWIQKDSRHIEQVL